MGWAALLATLCVGGVGTLMALRWRALRRGRQLASTVATEFGEWASLCRVLHGGAFLDRGRPRRGLGPRGVLRYSGECLSWSPDRYEVRHGDAAFAWHVSAVTCLGARRRRDISGIRVVEVRVRVPEGEVVLGLFHEAGVRPPFLGPLARAS